MQNRMQALAAHYENTRATFPRDHLIILFDIDGTILDGRYMMRYLLQAYDRRYGCDFFSHCPIRDIDFDGDNLDAGLRALAVPADHHAAIRDWYRRQRWSLAAILEAYRPFSGVMGVIRWFQSQPRTHVGLNTARPQSLREETLCSLNRLGREHDVRFASDLLVMREDDDRRTVVAAKLAGIEYFRAGGYRPFAMVDNQPQNLEAVAAQDPHGEILLLHAGMVYPQRQALLPAAVVRGEVYDPGALLSALPQHA